MKALSFYFWLCFFVLPIFTSFSSNSLSKEVVQHIPQHISVEPGKEFDKMGLFLRPIQFTRSGMENYFKNVFNDSEYKNFIAHDFSHITKFLNTAKRSLYPKTCTKNFLDFFGQKIKSTMYINSYMFVDFLHDLEDILKKNISIEQDLYERKTVIKDCLYNHFINNYSMAKSDPDKFFEMVSLDLINTIDSQSQEHDATLSELQRSIFEFLEISISKLMWNTTYKKHIWQSFKAISIKLEDLLHANGVSDLTQLDKLYWSLVHRFTYFLEIAGSELDHEAYLDIEKDLDQKKLPILALEEQEIFLTPKLQHLKSAVFDGHAKSHARNNFGIISEDIVPTKKLAAHKQTVQHIATTAAA